MQQVPRNELRIRTVARTVATMAVVSALLLLSGPASVSALDLYTVLDRVDETIEVQRARVAVEQARLEMDQTIFPGDPSLSLSPGLRADGSDGSSDVERWAATLNMSATVPVGLSEDQKARLDRARNAFAAAESELEQTRQDQTVRILERYHDLWLRGQEIIVLELETAALREQSRIDRLRFEQGEIAWDALLRSESEYRERQGDLSDAVRARRSSMIDLALAVQLDPGDLEDVAPPPGLHRDDSAPTSDALHAGDDAREPRTPAVAIQELALASAVAEAARTRGVFSQVTVRAGADLGDHSASLSYSILNPAVSLSYSPAPFVFSGSESGGGSSSGGGFGDYDWTVSLGVSIGLTGTRDDRGNQEARALVAEREHAVLAWVIAREQARLEDARARVDQAQQTRDDAGAALARAEVALEVMRARAGTGQARAVELDQATAALERARFNHNRATLGLEAALVRLAIVRGADDNFRSNDR